MYKTVTDNYLLSPILDHKEKYDLGGIEIRIANDYENNLRRRNCQFGIVEALTSENPLKLSLGDIVFVNHFTFHGDIGSARGFKLRPHSEVDGKKIFRVPERNIYFKYNDNNIEPLKDIVILEGIDSTDTDDSLDVIKKQYKDRGRIIYSVDESIIGKEVFVEKNALYALEFKDENLYRIYRNEIVGFVEANDLIPSEGRVLLEDFEEEVSSFLDLSLVKKSNTVKSKVIRVGLMTDKDHQNYLREGYIVLRFRNYGIKYETQVVVALADDNIHGVIL